VPNRNLRDFNLIYIDAKRRNRPANRGASAANSVSTDIGIFNGRSVLINDLLDADILLSK
jgi:hypothetical protein